MKRLLHAALRKIPFPGFLLLVLCCCVSPTVAVGQSESEPTTAKNIGALRSAIPLQSGCICAFDLEGVILAADCDSGTLFFQDGSGVSVLEADLNGVKLMPGERIRLSGTNFVSRSVNGFSLGTRPVINADNLHSTIARLGDLYLKAGAHPIRVKWFNQNGDYFLNLAYSGPHIPQQTIPASALFQNANALPGLRYRCFEGQWEDLPDFNSMVPRKVGTASNFDITVKSRDENVGLEFQGFLKVPEDGKYKFYLSSDDGSQLFLDDTAPQLSILETGPVPDVRPVTAGQPLGRNEGGFWAEARGTITFIGQYQNHVKFELSSDENRMQIEVLNTPPGIPWYLLNSRVSVHGICQDTKNIEGQKYAGSIIMANWQDLRVLEVAAGRWSAFGSGTIAGLNARDFATDAGVACLRGRIRFDPTTRGMRFEDGTGSAPISLLNGVSVNTNAEVECLTGWNRKGTNVFLEDAVLREKFKEPDKRSDTLPVLTTAIQVQQLTRQEAERKYPIEIQGVVTSVSPDYRSLLIQDATRAVFVWVGDESPTDLPHQGDYCKLEGVSRPADFSPIVVLSKATVLWKGQMPQPIKPTRDQLLSGSLDAQYVEIRGLVVAAHGTYLTVLTPDGTLDLNIVAPSVERQSFLNSIIRVRGCVVANWDPETHRVILESPVRLRLMSSTISMDTPAPADLFAAARIRASDLMQFDARFDTFRRLKVTGQIIHSTPDVYYLMDGATGLRFRLAQPSQLEPGDEVEVVGLVELGEASPALRQAVAKRTGHSLLPEPRPLSINSLSNNYDSTLVSVEGTLVEVQNHGSKQALGIQVGVRSFIARLDYKNQPASTWDIGSRLKLTGTFSALDGDRLAGRDVNSFELLLNSPADVHVIARPPWWTSTRLLVAIMCLLAGLALAFVWIALLRHQVDRRTRELGREITERERAEKLRAIEHERSRIARDLHDDLGSTLTEISMMATASPGLKIGAEMAGDRLREIADKSRSMVSALDGVVWVINSKNDTLPSLIEYLASFTEEFLSKARITYRVELPRDYADRTIAAETRHDVMLAVKEALNNAVRHGQSNEVLLRFVVNTDTLEILVQDDGCGFDPVQVNGNGLSNLAQRMAKLNGSCHIHSSPGAGTSVTLKLTLPK